jgi:hypothetical protein
MTTPITGTGQTVVPQGTQIEGTEQVKKTGSGTSGTADQVSYVARDQSGTDISQPTLDPPKMDANALSLMLLELRSKLSDVQAKTSQEDVKITMDAQKEKHAEIMKEIEKAAKAMEKSKKAGTWGKVFGWVSVAASAVAAVAMVALGAVAIATGVGAAAGVALIACGCIMGAMAVNQAVGMATEKDLMGWIGEGISKTLQAMGMEEELADKIGHMVTGGPGALVGEFLQAVGVDENVAKIVESVVNAVVMIAAMIALTVLTGGAGAAGAVSATVSATANAVKIGAQITSTVATLVSGLSQVGAGASTIAKAGFEHDAAMAEAEQKELQKFIAKFQAMMEEEQERLKKVMQELDESVSTVMGMISGNDDTTDAIIGKMNSRVMI